MIELENDELAGDIADLRLAIEQSAIRRDQLIRKQETASLQVEEENHAAIQKRLLEKTQQAEALTVRAPVSGRVMSRSLVRAAGTYAKPGTELVAIGHDTRKEMRVSISQDDARWLKSFAMHGNEDDDVRVRIRSAGLITGTIRRILPGASKTPLHESLTAPADGPLAVKTRSRPDGQSELVLIEPRVTAIIDLPPDVVAGTPAGTPSSRGRTGRRS